MRSFFVLVCLFIASFQAQAASTSTGAGTSSQKAEFVPAENIWIHQIDWDNAMTTWEKTRTPVYESQVMVCDDTDYRQADIKFEKDPDDSSIAVKVSGDCKQVGETSWGFNNWLRFDGPTSSCTQTFEYFEGGVKKAEVQIELTDAC